MGRKVYLRWKGKTLLGFVNKLLKANSLMISPINVLPFHLKENFLPIIWIFTENQTTYFLKFSLLYLIRVFKLEFFSWNFPDKLLVKFWYKSSLFVTLLATWGLLNNSQGGGGRHFSFFQFQRLCQIMLNPRMHACVICTSVSSVVEF